MYYCRYAQRQITTVQQSRGEPLINYVYHYDDLLRRYPDHGLTKYDVLDNFLRGMDPIWYHRLQDAAGGEWLGDMYVQEVWNLIEDLAGIPKVSDQKQSHTALDGEIVEFEDTVHDDEAMLREIKEIKEQLKGWMTQEIEKLNYELASMQPKSFDEDWDEVRRMNCTEPSLDLATMKHQAEFIIRATAKLREARRLEEEQEGQDLGGEIELNVDGEQFIHAEDTEDAQQCLPSVDQHSLAFTVNSELEPQSIIFDPLPLLPMQVIETNGEVAKTLVSQVGTRVSNQVFKVKDVAICNAPYTRMLLARAKKKIPKKMSRESKSYKDFGRELDWEGTGRMLPYKRCWRKRYVALRKFDHIYPWDPNL